MAPKGRSQPVPTHDQPPRASVEPQHVVNQPPHLGVQNPPPLAEDGRQVVTRPFEFSQVPGDGESHVCRQNLEMGIPPEESEEIWVRVGIEDDLNANLRALKPISAIEGTYKSTAQIDDHQ